MLDYFLEKEAELGSDDELHDDQVKPIVDSGSEDEEDMDQDLPELINNELQLVDENEEGVRQRYLQDMEREDKAQLKKVI